MPVITVSRLACLCCFLLLTSASHAAWQRVDANDVIDTLEEAIEVDGRRGFQDGGIQRFPGCAAAPAVVTSPDTGLPVINPDNGFPEIEVTPSEFSFFVDLGDVDPDSGDEPTPPTGLLIYFAGGGACWDAATCVGSALTPLPTYFPAFSETDEWLNFVSLGLDGVGAGGILSKAAPENPYAGYAKVYIPYCTGDVHVGSSDTSYSYGFLQDWPIHHRGFDNLGLVLRWLQTQQESRGWRIENATVAGSSAGGYGALINFPVIRAALGEVPDYSIIIDSANGVLTDGFLDRAFGLAEGAVAEPDMQTDVWGARQNIDPILQPVLDLDARTLWTSAFDTVGDAYRDTRISQSTSAYDTIQSLILLFMKKVDADAYDPFVEPTEAEILATALLDWSPKARLAMWSTAFSVPNYRLYLGAGAGHIHLIDPPPGAVAFETTNYYVEDSARKVPYTNWLHDMLNNPRRFFGTDWRNLSCFPNCLQ